jgi:hypothetical protein
MAEIRTKYFPNTSHVYQLQQPVQFLLNVPIQLRTRESRKHNRRTGNCVVSEENVDKEKGRSINLRRD